MSQPVVTVSMPSSDYVVDDYYASHPLMELQSVEEETMEDKEDKEDVTSDLVPPPPPTADVIHMCNSVNKYRKIARLNEGSYGVVYKAENIETGEIVALKRVCSAFKRDLCCMMNRSNLTKLSFFKRLFL